MEQTRKSESVSPRSGDSCIHPLGFPLARRKRIISDEQEWLPGHIFSWQEQQARILPDGRASRSMITPSYYLDAVLLWPCSRRTQQRRHRFPADSYYGRHCASSRGHRCSRSQKDDGRKLLEDRHFRSAAAEHSLCPRDYELASVRGRSILPPVLGCIMGMMHSLLRRRGKDLLSKRFVLRYHAGGNIPIGETLKFCLTIIYASLTDPISRSKSRVGYVSDLFFFFLRDAEGKVDS